MSDFMQSYVLECMSVRLFCQLFLCINVCRILACVLEGLCACLKLIFRLSFDLIVYPPVHLHVFINQCVYFCPSVCPSVCLSVRLNVIFCVRLFVNLSVCISQGAEPEKNATLMPRRFEKNFFPNLISTTFWLYDRI